VLDGSLPCPCLKFVLSGLKNFIFCSSLLAILKVDLFFFFDDVIIAMMTKDFLYLISTRGELKSNRVLQKVTALSTFPNLIQVKSVAEISLSCVWPVIFRDG
jgi:hypothetical protein